MNCKPHIAFMSCEPADESQLESSLKSLELRYSTGTGCYKGVSEKSYLILLGTESHLAESRLAKLVELGNEFNQESILYCDNERTAYLMSCTGPEAPLLGTLQEVAVPKGDYSLFNDRYYEVK